MDKTQLRVANSFGYGIEEIPLKTCPKLTYYKNDGTPLPNLPADPYHMKRYLERGFSIEPPKVAEVMTPQPAVAVSEIAPKRRKKRKSRKSNKEK